MKIRSLLLLLLLGMAGCQSAENAKESTEGMTAREIIEKDVFISLTPADIAAKSTPECPVSCIAEGRAATYRFYKQVSFDENNIATCRAKTGAELKMSEELFKFQLLDLENSNRMIREDLKKGIKGYRSKLDDAYFNRLLDEEFWKKQAELLRKITEGDGQKAGNEEPVKELMELMQGTR